MNNKVAIIIPMYGHWELLHARLHEIYKHCLKGNDLLVVIVDDCSPDVDSRGIVGWWQSQVYNDKLKFYRNKENRGFGGSCNKGAKIAQKYGADILVLLSSDVEIHGPFLEQIETTLLNDPTALVGGRLLEGFTGWNQFSFGLVPYLEGWLLACTSDTWLELGGFDPGIYKYDAEDIEISIKARFLGKNLVHLNNPNVRHIGGQSIGYGPEREAITRKNLAYVEDKWSKILGSQDV